MQGFFINSRPLKSLYWLNLLCYNENFKSLAAKKRIKSDKNL
jgi:hypothetical protein